MCEKLKNLFKKSKPAPEPEPTPEPELQKPTGYPKFKIHWVDLVKVLAENGIELRLRAKFAPDVWVYYTDEESWAKIVPFLVYPADYYVSQACDCDEYAKKASADASFEFELNGCLQAWGEHDMSHAFGLVMTSLSTFKLFEMNAGFPWAGVLFDPEEILAPDEENGYTVESWDL